MVPFLQLFQLFVCISYCLLALGLLRGEEEEQLQTDILDHDFFKSPFIITPRHLQEHANNNSLHILFGRKLVQVVSPFLSNTPTGYITAKFFFDGSTECTGYPTMKTNAMGICFADFSNGGSMMFTTPGTSINKQMLFYQQYYNTPDCSGGYLSEVQYLNTECLAAKYSDPLGRGSPYYYEYSTVQPDIHDYGLLLTGYTVRDDCFSKIHGSYFFWFPINLCQNGMMLTSCTEDPEAYNGNTTLEFYNNRLCQGNINHTESRVHKHCVHSTDDDEPQNNYFTTRCTGVPHPKGPVYLDVYIFPFCVSVTDTVQLLVESAPIDNSNHSIAEADALCTEANVCDNIATAITAISATKLEPNYRIVPITEVKVGDKILTSNRYGTEFSYSEVIVIPHANNQINAYFYHVKTKTGKSIKMMSKHVINVIENCDMQRNTAIAAITEEGNVLKLAEDVLLSDCLITIDGVEAIQTIDYINENGIYSVITMNEMIVVNGIVTSPFAVGCCKDCK